MFIPQQERVAIVKVTAKPRVMIQPPERRLRKDKVIGATDSHGLELCDRGGVPRRVVAEVATVTPSRKVQAPTVSELQQPLVPLRRDEDNRPRGDQLLHPSLDLVDDAGICIDAGSGLLR